MDERNFDFGETFVEANKTLFKETNQWLNLVTGPWLLLLAGFLFNYIAVAGMGFSVDLSVASEVDSLEVKGNTGMSGYVIAMNVLGFLITFCAMIIIQVRAYRYKLLEEMPANLISLEWEARHWRLIGYSLVYIFSIIAVLVLAYFLGVIAIILTLLGILYISGRIIFFGTLISIDHANPIQGSWELTGGWLWLKVLFLSILVSIPMAIGLGLLCGFIGFFTPAFLGPQTLNSLITNVVISLIMVTALSSAYRQLSTK